RQIGSDVLQQLLVRDLGLRPSAKKWFHLVSRPSLLGVVRRARKIPRRAHTLDAVALARRLRNLGAHRTNLVLSKGLWAWHLTRRSSFSIDSSPIRFSAPQTRPLADLRSAAPVAPTRSRSVLGHATG